MFPDRRLQKVDDATLGRMVRRLYAVAKANRWTVKLLVTIDDTSPTGEYWYIEFRDKGWGHNGYTPEAAIGSFLDAYKRERAEKRRKVMQTGRIR